MVEELEVMEDQVVQEDLVAQEDQAAPEDQMVLKNILPQDRPSKAPTERRSGR